MFWIPAKHDKESINNHQGKALDILVHVEWSKNSGLRSRSNENQSHSLKTHISHLPPQKRTPQIIDMTPIRNNKTRAAVESSTDKNILLPELKSESSPTSKVHPTMIKKYSRTKSSVRDLDLSDLGSGDNDASSVSSYLSHEEFEPVQVMIGKRDGIIALHYPEDQFSDESSFQMGYSDDSFQSPIGDDDDGNGTYGKMNDMMKQHRSHGSLSTCFELESTKHQNHKDDKQKQYHHIRIACLEVAVDSYKKASIDIPDVSNLYLSRLGTKMRILLSN